MNQSKIVIATTAQPSANPRMVKEVVALLKQGYQVKVFYAYSMAWADKGDSVFLNAYPGVFYMVGGNPINGKGEYLFSRVLRKAARVMAKFIPFFREYAINRSSFFLERALSREKADLFIGHNIGSLPAVVKAARKWNVRCGFDAEDYHRGEFIVQSGEAYRDVTYVEEKYIIGCNYLTAASPLIARAYERLFPNKKFIVINNVFSGRFLQPEQSRGTSHLRLFWFSQNIGPERGLEMIIRAINLLPGYDISLHLMGNCSDDFRLYLERVADQPSRLHFLPPHAPDEIFSISASYDVGLAAEVTVSDNRNFCLTNKLFTYLLAGNCILASDTEAQRLFMEESPGIGLLYKYGEPQDMADRIADLYNDPHLLQKCKHGSRTLAATRYNWESEQNVLLEQVASALGLKHKLNNKIPL